MTQTDDPAHVASVGIDAVQNHIANHSNGTNPNLAIVLSVIDPLEDRAVKQKNCQIEWQAARDRIPSALGRVPFKIHWRRLYVKVRYMSKTYRARTKRHHLAAAGFPSFAAQRCPLYERDLRDLGLTSADVAGEIAKPFWRA
jgi:hypothetical protein